MQRAQQQQRINAAVAAAGTTPNQQQLNYQQMMLHQQQKAQQQAKQAAAATAAVGSPTISTVPSPVNNTASPVVASTSPVVSTTPTPTSVTSPVIVTSPAPTPTPQQQFQVSNLSRAFQFSAQTPQVQTFMNQIAEQNPSLTPDQVSQIAKTQIQRILMQQRMISTTGSTTNGTSGPASAPAVVARASGQHPVAVPHRQATSAPGGPVAGMFAVNANTRNIAVTGQQQQQRPGTTVRTTPSPVMQTIRAPAVQQQGHLNCRNIAGDCGSTSCNERRSEIASVGHSRSCNSAAAAAAAYS